VGRGFESLPLRQGEEGSGVRDQDPSGNGFLNPEYCLLFIEMSWIALAIWAVIVLAAFGWAWKTGQIAKLTDYVLQTREELRKCSWPTWDELKGSTLVVFMSILILGVFTVVVDQVVFRLFMLFRL
jgi:preprotein translocase subunit SecE